MKIREYELPLDAFELNKQLVLSAKKRQFYVSIVYFRKKSLSCYSDIGLRLRLDTVKKYQGESCNSNNENVSSSLHETIVRDVKKINLFLSKNVFENKNSMLKSKLETSKQRIVKCLNQKTLLDAL
jgi:hypothetical protein